MGYGKMNGWSERRNVVIAWRSADGFTRGCQNWLPIWSQAARRSTHIIPIVLAIVADANQLAAKLAELPIEQPAH